MREERAVVENIEEAEIMEMLPKCWHVNWCV